MIRRYRWQALVGQINFFWHGLLWVLIFRFVLRYRVKDMREYRRSFAEIYKNLNGKPLLICSNHLSLIDSMIINWLLSNPVTYCFNFRRMPWNVPEFSNYGKNLWLKAMCYLGKCVYVERQGAIQSKKQTIMSLKLLLENREMVCLFPEGGRTRTPRINPEKYSSGAGYLVQSIPDLHVLCLYVRSSKQKSYAAIPPKGSQFKLLSKLLPPSAFRRDRGDGSQEPNENEIKGSPHKAHSKTIIDAIIELEKQYFNALS